jgi:hypothetical protein
MTVMTRRRTTLREGLQAPASHHDVKQRMCRKSRHDPTCRLKLINWTSMTAAP